MFYQISLHQLPAELVSENLELTVEVVSVPHRDDHKLRFIAYVLECDSCVVPVGVQKIRLSWYRADQIVRAGERWQLTVRLKPLGSLRNAGSFDVLKWGLNHKIYATGYITHARAARRIASASRSVLSFRESALLAMRKMPAANHHLGLVEALTLGIKSSVSMDTWQLLRQTGTAHLLAISGLHISLVAAAAMLIGKLLAHSLQGIAIKVGVRFFDARTIGIFCAVLAAVGYAALAGFELPTQRAVAMLFVWAVASLRYRVLPAAQALAAAMILVLLLDALNPLGVGFWLSFGTVAALLYLHNGHQSISIGPQDDDSRWGWRSALHKLAGGFRTHINLGLVLLPVSAWFFQQGSLSAPMANLIAVPWVGLVCVPLSLLSLALSLWAPALANAVLALAQFSIQWLLVVLESLDSWLLAAPVLTVPDATVMGVSLLGLVVLFAPRGLGYRWLAIALFAPIVSFNTPAISKPALQHDGFEVHSLDVGQGLATLVFTRNNVLLFDTGGKVSSNLSMVEAAVVPFLHAKGRRSIDTLVLSHLDDDHAFGLDDIVRRFPDVQIMASRLPPQLQTFENVSQCQAGTSWNSDGVTYAFLHPSGDTAHSDNDRSCVLLIYQGLSRVLFTGDIESAGESLLLQRLNSAFGEFVVDMLVAPHHGSNSSSGQKLLDFFQPAYVVFSAGRRNRYGFPHQDVQMRYKLMGAKPFVTGEQGTVSFSFGNNGLRKPPQIWWHSHRRFWHGIVNPDCWQLIADQSKVQRLLTMAQKGHTLCGI